MTKRTQLQVLADHRNDGTPFYEILDVLAAGDAYRLVHSPAFVQGIAAGDVFELDDEGWARVRTRGGNVCIQVMSTNPTPEFVRAVQTAMRGLGVFRDGFGPKVYVFTAPVSVGFSVIEDALDPIVQRFEAEWYFGNVYDSCDGTPLNWWL